MGEAPPEQETDVKNIEAVGLVSIAGEESAPVANTEERAREADPVVGPTQGKEEASSNQGTEEPVAIPPVEGECLEVIAPTPPPTQESPEEGTPKEKIQGRGAPSDEDTPVELPATPTKEVEDPYRFESDPPNPRERCPIPEAEVSPVEVATEEDEVAQVEVAVHGEVLIHEAGSSMEEGGAQLRAEETSPTEATGR